MLKKPAKLAALVTLLLFAAVAFASLLPDGQATTQTQTNASSSPNSGNQKKKDVSQKDADNPAKDKAAKDKAAKDKLAEEDKLSKERYSTRGLHPQDKTGESKTSGDSSKQNSQTAAKSDAKDAK
jgi:hypothetical protein